MTKKFSDSNGKPIRAGARLFWVINGSEQTGIVVEDWSWNGGLKIAGMSLPYLLETADRVLVVQTN